MNIRSTNNVTNFAAPAQATRAETEQQDKQEPRESFSSAFDKNLDNYGIVLTGAYGSIAGMAVGSQIGTSLGGGVGRAVGVAAGLIGGAVAGRYLGQSASFLGSAVGQKMLTDKPELGSLVGKGVAIGLAGSALSLSPMAGVGILLGTAAITTFARAVES